MELIKPLERIKRFIEDELTKRGFHVSIEVFELIDMRNSTDKVLKIRTSTFQTTPCLFKELQVYNFGGTVKQDGDRCKLWIPVNVGWESFRGGSNSTDLFTVKAEYLIDDEYVRPHIEIS